jgi:hypothetical protein
MDRLDPAPRELLAVPRILSLAETRRLARPVLDEREVRRAQYGHVVAPPGEPLE